MRLRLILELGVVKGLALIRIAVVHGSFQTPFHATRSFTNSTLSNLNDPCLDYQSHSGHPVSILDVSTIILQLFGVMAVSETRLTSRPEKSCSPRSEVRQHPCSVPKMLAFLHHHCTTLLSFATARRSGFASKVCSHVCQPSRIGSCKSEIPLFPLGAGRSA